MNTKPIEFYIISAAGFGNFGDDAIFASIYHKLSRFGKVFLVTQNPKVKHNIQKQFAVECTEHPGDKDHSIVIIGGGTLFDKGVNPPDPYLHAAKNLIDQGYQVYFDYIGVVSFFDEALAADVFGRCAGIAVRDQESADIIMNATESHRIPAVVGDAAEDYPLPDLRREPTSTIGISLTRKENFDEQEIVTLIQTLQKHQPDVSFEWFSFSHHIEGIHEDDIDYGITLKETYKLPITINKTANLNDLLVNMTSYTSIITSRLHITVFAKKLGIPVFNVSNEQKNKRYCKEFGLWKGTIAELIQKYIKKV